MSQMDQCSLSDSAESFQQALSVMYLFVSQGYSTVYSKALENIGNF